ncbi:hypothetical protein CR513_38153, partial [Mucuna pruriens]
MVNEIDAVDNLRLENQLTELTSLVRQLAIAQHQPSIAAKVCGICTSMEHSTDMCPTLQEIELDHSESQNMNATIQDLKTGNVSEVTLTSGKELPQLAPQQLPRPTDADSELDANSQRPQQDKAVPLPFPTQTLSTKKLEFDEELLRMFRKVEINIPLLDVIKQIPKSFN